MRVLSLRIVGAMLAASILVQTGFAVAKPTGVGYGILSERVHQQLNLTPALETQWQALKTEQTALRSSMRESHQQIRTLFEAELAKPQPDLTAVNNAVDAAHQANYAAQKAVRQKLLDFYSALTPERQSIVIAALKAKLQRAQDWHKQHPRQHAPQSNG
jgi:Spy/CpxP family protein refolding chaperone